MDTRRRSAKFGLILALLLFGSAHANVRLDIQTGHDSLRFAVPDALYTAGITADFSGLRIQGEDGRDIAFAVCPISLSQAQKLQVPLLAIPDLARPQLNPDGSLGSSRPAGAGPIESVSAWILDLRGIGGNLQALRGVPPIRSFKLSPDLQQWSGEITFQQERDRVSIQPRPAKFVRLIPAQETPWKQAPPQIEFVGESNSGRRKPRWFSPQKMGDGSFDNSRTLPIIAARLEQTGPNKSWQLQSRQGKWDAWKPRGGFIAGDRQSNLRFSAVTDPQWRVQGVQNPSLQLAHAAHDIRLPKVSATATLALIYDPEQRGSPSLSCPSTEHLPSQAPTRIELADNSVTPASQAPGNVRSAFLVILGAVLILGFGLRRFLLRRRAG